MATKSQIEALRREYEFPRVSFGREAVSTKGKYTKAYSEFLENIAAEHHGTCKWVQDGDGVWQTECKQSFTFDCVDGTPDNYDFKHCPYCGKKLEV